MQHVQRSSLFARANIQPFCTCKRAILTVANLDTYVVLFVLNKGVKDEVEKVFQPKREELEVLNGICLEE